jgi:hypothetical protein
MAPCGVELKLRVSFLPVNRVAQPEAMIATTRNK